MPLSTIGDVNLNSTAQLMAQAKQTRPMADLVGHLAQSNTQKALTEVVHALEA